MMAAKTLKGQTMETLQTEAHSALQELADRIGARNIRDVSRCASAAKIAALYARRFVREANRAAVDSTARIVAMGKADAWRMVATLCAADNERAAFG